MTTIYLDPNMVPANLRRGYDGKKFKARVCESMTIPITAGLWDGGSRDTYQIIRLEDGALLEPINHNAAPVNGERCEIKVKFEPGIAVIEHSITCGKDMGLTFYVHPDNATKLLPAPQAELTVFEKIVLCATASYKSSYGGMDRYEMARRDCRNETLFPTRDDWALAKQTLINLGLLNKAGAITPAGRNAIPSRY
jgi:hypothetical protein